MSATTTTTSTAAADVDNLIVLYFTRFVFAVAWLGTFAAVGSSLGAASITLLILYPVFDVAAAAFDVRTSRNPVLYVNMAISTVAAIGLAFAAADDIPAVLRVWGVWAIVAGSVQLFLALKRRGIGGQVPMILSGSISVLAGLAFLGQASGATSMKMLAGYAGLGALFFLISAVRLRSSNSNKNNPTQPSEAR
jgi:uncharacterized membrane protein HdeD (DUF308 family)